MYIRNLSNFLLPLLFAGTTVFSAPFNPDGGELSSPDAIDNNGNTFHHDLDARYNTLKTGLDAEMKNLYEVIEPEGLYDVVHILDHYNDQKWVQKNINRVINGGFQRDSQVLSHWVHKPVPEVLNEDHKYDQKYRVFYSQETVTKQLETVENLSFRIKNVIEQQKRQGDAGWEDKEKINDTTAKRISNIRGKLNKALKAVETLQTWFADMPTDWRKADPLRRLPFDPADYFRQRLLKTPHWNDKWWIDWYSKKRKWIDSMGRRPMNLESYREARKSKGRPYGSDLDWPGQPREAAMAAAERAADNNYVKYQIVYALLKEWQKIIQRGIFNEDLPVRLSWMPMQGSVTYTDYWVQALPLNPPTTKSTNSNWINEHVSKARSLLGNAKKGEPYKPAGAAYDYLLRKGLKLAGGIPPVGVKVKQPPAIQLGNPQQRDSK